LVDGLDPSTDPISAAQEGAHVQANELSPMPKLSCPLCGAAMRVESPRVVSCTPCRAIVPVDDSHVALQEASAFAEACANPPTGKRSEMS
jgi:hypothetical protein